MLLTRTMFTGTIVPSQHKQSHPHQLNTLKSVSAYSPLAEDKVSFSNAKLSRNQPRFGMDGSTHPRQNQPVKVSYLDLLEDEDGDEDFNFDVFNDKGGEPSSSVQQKELARQARNQAEKRFRERKKIDISYMEEQLKEDGIDPKHLKPSVPKHNPKQKNVSHNEAERASKARRNQYLERLHEEFAKLLVRQNSLELLAGIQSPKIKRALKEKFNILIEQASVISPVNRSTASPFLSGYYYQLDPGSSFQQAAENAIDKHRKEYDEDRL